MATDWDYSDHDYPAGYQPLPLEPSMPKPRGIAFVAILKPDGHSGSVATMTVYASDIDCAAELAVSQCPDGHFVIGVCQTDYLDDVRTGAHIGATLAR